MTKKGTKINNTKLKYKLEKYYNQSINELRQYTNGSTGAFFKNGTFRFVSKKNIKKNHEELRQLRINKFDKKRIERDGKVIYEASEPKKKPAKKKSPNVLLSGGGTLTGRISRRKKVKFEQYMTIDPILLTVVKKITNRKMFQGSTFIDPCAGSGALFSLLPQPKKAFDIDSRMMGKKQNFLTSNRKTYIKNGKLTLVINPPFTLPKSIKNGVVAFLNHAYTIMKNRERVILIAPQTMTKWANIHKITSHLHLEEQTIIRQKCSFVVKGKKELVYIVVQVWCRKDTPRRQPEFLKESPEFKMFTSYDDKADFFVSKWSETFNISKPRILSKEKRKNARNSNGVTYFSTPVGSLTDDPSAGSGTATTLMVTAGTKRKIYSKFLRMKPKIDKLLRFRSAGCAPVLTFPEIYTIYHKGPSYLSKEKWGIQTRII